MYLITKSSSNIPASGAISSIGPVSLVSVVSIGLDCTILIPVVIRPLCVVFAPEVANTTVSEPLVTKVLTGPGTDAPASPMTSSPSGEISKSGSLTRMCTVKSPLPSVSRFSSTIPGSFAPAELSVMPVA